MPAALAALLCCAASVAQSPADGEGGPPFDAGGPPRWSLRFEPAVYFVGLSGDLTLPGAEGGSFARGELDLADDLNLDEPRLRPFGEMHYRRGRLRVTASGFSAGAESGAVAGAGPSGAVITSLGRAPVFGGEEVETELSFVSAELELGYRVLGGRVGYEDQLGYGVDVYAGARVHSVGFEGRVIPSSGARTGGEVLTAEADELFVEPIVGARLELELYERFGIDVASSVGGFGAGGRSSFSYDILTGFWADPMPWLSVQVGFRLLLVDLETGGGFEWGGTAAGLYWGVGVSY